MKPAKALKLGFTGTQEKPTVRQIRTVAQAMVCHCLIEYLPVEFHHGDCVGADYYAHLLARALWFKIWIHPPTDESRRAFCNAMPERILPAKPFLERNKDIVEATEILIAAPRGPEEVRSGTWSTVRYARKRGRPIYICWPDGRLTFENVPTQQERYAAKGRVKVPVAEALKDSLAEPPTIYCAVCGSFQFDTPSGLTCGNGHGGADTVEDPVTASGLRSKWQRALKAGL